MWSVFKKRNFAVKSFGMIRRWYAHCFCCSSTPQQRQLLYRYLRPSEIIHVRHSQMDRLWSPASQGLTYAHRHRLTFIILVLFNQLSSYL